MLILKTLRGSYKLQKTAAKDKFLVPRKANKLFLLILEAAKK